MLEACRCAKEPSTGAATFAWLWPAAAFNGHREFPVWACSSSPQLWLETLFAAACVCHTALEATCHAVALPAGIIVPPVPEKNAVQKFQMTHDFIEQRRLALQSFINRVVRSLRGAA